MDEVVTADRQRVAVTRNHPNAELRICTLDAGCDCRRAAMNTVEAVGVHVIRKARRTADAGHKNDLLARDAELGHDFLHVVENRVVTATRTPAYFLIGNEVSFLQLPRRRRNAP